MGDKINEINVLKAKVYDCMVLIDRHQLSIQNIQQQIAELNKQIQEIETSK